MKPQPRYQPGDRIGDRYQVHKTLMGGMSEVYLCLDLEENYPFALKTFQQLYLTDKQRLRHIFEEEVATWIALENHPNIVRCFYMNMIDNQPFMKLEWIASEEGNETDLRSWLRRGPLDLKLALEIAIDICRGLIHAQEKRPGLVHRDLKPENILIAQGGLAKITDFGLAQIVQTAGLEVDIDDVRSSSGRQSFVNTGKGIVGTPAYMAPEQWCGEPVGEYTDIYAIGCILYEMLTGTPPFMVAFTQITPFQMQKWLAAMQHSHQTRPYPKLPPNFPSALSDLLRCCLAKSSSDRLADLDNLMIRLTDFYYQHFNQFPPLRPEPAAFSAADYNNRGLTYRLLGQYRQSLADYDCAIELDPNHTETYVNRGTVYVALGQLTQALDEFSHAIALNPNFAPAYTNRGLTYTTLEQFTQALDDHNRAIAIDPDSLLSYMGRGKTYVALKQYVQALDDFRRVLTIDPNHASAYVDRGDTYKALGKREEMREDFDRALKLDAHNAAIYMRRGNTYIELGEYIQALADYNCAIELAPNDSLAYYNRGNTYRALGRLAESLLDYTRAIDLNADYTKAYYNRGNSYAELKQHAEALTDFSRAIDLDPNFIQAYFNRGNSYQVLGRYIEAIADYSCAIDLDPNYTKVYINRGVTYAMLEQYANSSADYDRVLELDPNSAQAYYNRGKNLVALGQYPQALVDFDSALALDPNLIPPYVHIGANLVVQGRLEDALPYFEQGARLGDPQGAEFAAEARQMLSMAQMRQMDLGEQAWTAFAQANTLDTMGQAVERFPLLGQTNFIATIEQAITQQVPPEHQPEFMHRLACLKQIVVPQSKKECPQ